MRLLLLLVALVVAPSAGATELRLPELTRATAIASGVPSPDVSCEADEGRWDTEARAVLAIPGANLYGYTSYVPTRVRLAPWVCQNLTPASSLFGAALHVVAGEAGRIAETVRDDGMNGCWGLLWVADLARQVWRIPFFTAASERVIRQAVEMHRLYGPQYRTICR